MTLLEVAQILGNFGEFFGAIAVVISLIFVGISVRQNTKALKSSTLHDVKDTIQDVNLAWAENDELAEIMHEGLSDLDSLSGARRFRFYTSAHNLFLGYENLYLQRSESVLEDKYWSGMAQHMIDVLTVPGMQAYWAERKQWFTNEFQDYIDNEVIPKPPHPGYRQAGT